MKIRSLFLVALMAAAVVAPLSAQADEHCSTTIVIFSYPASINSQVLVCVLAEQEAEDAGLDPRLINPGSDAISIRYTTDLGAGVPTLTAVLDGLGFEGEEVTLTRGEVALGLFAYDSPLIPLPNGATSSGCVTATVALTQEANSFHTIDASCG